MEMDMEIEMEMDSEVGRKREGILRPAKQLQGAFFHCGGW
jgi:hypothetical protein